MINITLFSVKMICYGRSKRINLVNLIVFPKVDKFVVFIANQTRQIHSTNIGKFYGPESLVEI